MCTYLKYSNTKLLRLKGKFYKNLVRLTILYGSEYGWLTRKYSRDGNAQGDEWSNEL